MNPEAADGRARGQCMRRTKLFTVLQSTDRHATVTGAAPAGQPDHTAGMGTSGVRKVTNR